jgi:hypothetical protein
MLLAAVSDAPAILKHLGALALPLLKPLLVKAEKKIIKEAPRLAKKGVNLGKSFLKKIGVNFDGPAVASDEVKALTSGFVRETREGEVEISHAALETTLLPTGQLVPFPGPFSSSRLAVS